MYSVSHADHAVPEIKSNMHPDLLFHVVSTTAPLTLAAQYSDNVAQYCTHCIPVLTLNYKQPVHVH